MAAVDLPPRVILVCGVPGAGKSGLARRLGSRLHLPTVVRDDIKTGLATTRGTPTWADHDARNRLGHDGFDLFHRVLGLHLDAGCSLVAEAAWHWGFARRELLPRLTGTHATLVHVTVALDVATTRYRQRHQAGVRHPSHHDGRHAPTMADPGFDWARYLPPDDLPLPVVTVDGHLEPDALADATLAALA